MSEAGQYAPGQQLPGTVYRVVRHLATGGMGSVYDVEDVTVGKRYVLKTLHPQLVSRHDLAKRMEAEARTLAKLQHPNIVDVVTAGVTTDERRMPFYVMERLNGQNLRVVLEKKGALELSHCYRIAIDVLDALEQAHENAVIHRDVKPENIFLHRNPNGTTITKLLDFGIMRLLDRKASHTQGKFIGTLRYASPEQIMGGDLGPATDIYSLGIVLYEMIAGRGPFDEIGDAMAIGVAHVQRPPPPLSTFVANVPPAVERLVMSSIGKLPHERPRDAFSFASELRRLLRDEEAAPRSATAVNVLTSAPQTRAGAPLASSSPTDAAPPPSPVRASGPSTLVEDGNPADKHVPATVRHAASGDGATDIGTAPTVASDPMHILQAARANRAAEAAAAAQGPPAVDRSAATRTSGVSGFTQRLAQHGTSMEDLSQPPLASEEAVSEALAQRAPLEVPPTSGNPPHSDSLVFASSSRYGHPGTGPIAGEARTRPPERGLALGLAAAAIVAVLLVGGAVLAVKKPWVKASTTPTTESAVATATPPAVTTTPTSPATAPSAPAATATAATTATPTATATATAAVTVATTTPTVAASPSAVTPSPPAVPTVKGRAGATATPASTATHERTPAAPPKETASAPGKKPPRPPSGAVRPEDVGFE
ncbi:MAG: protein kinase [Deltaproteobacteria bacterium]|nr:protein kinase [Deltaproteobacteria bacterium]